MAGKKKRPKAVVSTAGSKTPVVEAPPVPQVDLHPAWRLRRLDHDGPWGWSNVSATVLLQVVEFLKAMETLTWGQVWQQQAGGQTRRGQKHKFIPMDHCVGQAQKRLHDLGLEEYSESWFRFRIFARGRLWGIIQGGCFSPVWWDPDHQVCPNRDQ
jgi:hypothetical protein